MSAIPEEFRAPGLGLGQSYNANPFYVEGYRDHAGREIWAVCGRFYDTEFACARTIDDAISAARAMVKQRQTQRAIELRSRLN